MNVPYFNKYQITVYFSSSILHAVPTQIYAQQDKRFLMTNLHCTMFSYNCYTPFASTMLTTRHTHIKLKSNNDQTEFITAVIILRGTKTDENTKTKGKNVPKSFCWILSPSSDFVLVFASNQTWNWFVRLLHTKLMDMFMLDSWSYLLQNARF